MLHIEKRLSTKLKVTLGVVILTSAVAASGQSTTIYSYAVPANGYAANGNLVAFTDFVAGSWQMQYDTLNRLTGATGTGGAYQGESLQWQYDSFGNRKSQTPGGSGGARMPGPWSATFEPSSSTPATNRIVASSSGIPEYDAAGNMTFDGAATYAAYDAENRLCATYSTIGSSGVTQYIYNAEGQRVAKGHPASSSGNVPVCPTSMSNFVTDATYVLGPGGEQMTELDGAGNWRHTNVFTDGTLLATYDSHGVHFPQSDPLGTVRVQASATGAVEESCASLPFGDGQNCTPQIAEPTEHHFTGKERDAESGLDYFGARYYASNMGRWMSPDWSSSPVPIPYANLNSPQSLNLYGYVGNNPLLGRDLDGHIDCSGANASGVGCQAIAEWNAMHGVAERTLNRVGQAVTGTAEFSIRDSGDRAALAQRILAGANTAASIIVPAIATDGMSLEAEGGMAFGTLAETSVGSELSSAAGRAVGTVGEGQGAVYGTRVHSAFETEVNALGNSNLSTEVSYLNGKVVSRGTPGSVRIDVIEGARTNPTAAYDLKTGQTGLSPSRVQQIQSHLPGGNKVPVHEVRP